MKNTPISAKTTFYLSDGTGRDTYIHYNSGGLVAPSVPQTRFDSGITMM